MTAKCDGCEAALLDDNQQGCSYCFDTFCDDCTRDADDTDVRSCDCDWLCEACRNADDDMCRVCGVGGCLLCQADGCAVCIPSATGKVTMVCDACLVKCHFCEMSMCRDHTRVTALNNAENGKKRKRITCTSCITTALTALEERLQKEKKAKLTIPTVPPSPPQEALLKSDTK